MALSARKSLADAWMTYVPQIVSRIWLHCRLHDATNLKETEKDRYRLIWTTLIDSFLLLQMILFRLSRMEA